MTDDDKGFMTCTVVSHHPPTKAPYHLLMLSENYRDVPNHVSCHRDEVLKLTTTHVKSGSLRKIFKNIRKTLPFVLVSKLPNESFNVEALQAESPFKTDDNVVSFRYRNICIEFSKEGNFVRSADSLKGSFRAVKNFSNPNL